MNGESKTLIKLFGSIYHLWTPQLLYRGWNGDDDDVEIRARRVDDALIREGKDVCGMTEECVPGSRDRETGPNSLVWFSGTHKPPLQALGLFADVLPRPFTSIVCRVTTSKISHSDVDARSQMAPIA